MGLCRQCGKNRCGSGWCCDQCKEIRRESNRRKLLSGVCPYCGKKNDTSNCECSECQKKRRCRYNPEKNREKSLQLKLQAFDVYGGRKCACCGESILEFLQIDHVNDDGAEHRKEIGKYMIGVAFYKWLKRNGYPPGYQVLCANCNIAKSRYGQCPHQRDKCGVGVVPTKVTSAKSLGSVADCGQSPADQIACCNICGRKHSDDRKFRFYVDRCSETGLVRGTLCSRCHFGIGKFADDAAKLERAAKYLREQAGN